MFILMKHPTSESIQRMTGKGREDPDEMISIHWDF